MKLSASALLVLAAGLYVFSLVVHWKGIGYLRAGSEAAMVGGLADWFAHQREFCFYSSSVLIIYEGAAVYQATQHNITNQHVSIDGDEDLLDQALINLVRNATKPVRSMPNWPRTVTLA